MGHALVLLLMLLVGAASGVKIAVSGLMPITTDANLADLFQAFGRVDAAYVHRDSTTGLSRGTGTVIMADGAAASRAISRLVTVAARIVPDTSVLPVVTPPGLGGSARGIPRPMNRAPRVRGTGPRSAPRSTSFGRDRP